MLTEISAGWASLKAAREVVQAINGLENATLINDVKLTLQRHLLEAQDSLFAAQNSQAEVAGRIRELEKEIMEMKDWSAQSEAYELVTIGAGAFAYLLKPAMRGFEPAHWLCANCFGERKKSILQNKGSAGDVRFHIYACPSCKSEATVHREFRPTYDFAFRYRDPSLQA